MFAKKSKFKNVRNVLKSPFHTQQWTEKREDELLTLTNLLRELLPVAKLEQVNKLLKEKQGNKKPSKTVLTKRRNQNIYRNFLAPGFQSVVRGLEKSDLCCVVLAGNITPLLQKVVLAYTQISCVPVTIISDLKKITKSALGFATMVLGFKNVVADSENKFFPIYNSISQVRIFFHTTPTSLSEDTETTMDQTECLSESFKTQIQPENVYLERNHTGERTFIPEIKNDKNAKIIIKSEKNNVDGFIPLRKEPSENINRSINKKKGFDFKGTSDDSNSDMDSIFFVDTKQDESLLETKNVDLTKNTQRNKAKFRINSKKGISHNMSKTNNVDSKHGSNSTLNVLQNKKYSTKKSQMKKTFSEIPNEFRISKIHNKSTHITAAKSSQQQMNPHHLSHVNFNPLKIKTISHNSKKIRRNK